MEIKRGTAPSFPLILRDRLGAIVDLSGAAAVEVYIRQRAEDVFITYHKDAEETSENIEVSDGSSYTLILTPNADDLYMLREGKAELQVAWIDEDGRPQACVAGELPVDKLTKGHKIV